MDATCRAHNVAHEPQREELQNKRVQGRGWMVVLGEAAMITAQSGYRKIQFDKAFCDTNQRRERFYLKTTYMNNSEGTLPAHSQIKTKNIIILAVANSQDDLTLITQAFRLNSVTCQPYH